MNTQTWKVSKLTAHPDQQDIYGDLCDVEFSVLKNDIAVNGLRQPIEVTKDGIIIDGHQRVRAFRELGRVEIDVIVVQELDPESLKERFILANLLRRQLDPIAKARAIKAVAEIQQRRDGHEPNVEDDSEFRDRLARQLGGNISGRTVGRHLQLLRLPRAIQDAVSSRALPLTKALKVEALSLEQQQQFASRLEAGESVRQVYDDYITPRPRSEPCDTPADLYFVLIDFLDESLQVLESAAKALPGKAGNHDNVISLLDRTSAFCRRMKQLELEARHEAIEKVSRRIGDGNEQPAGHGDRRGLPSGS